MATLVKVVLVLLVEVLGKPKPLTARSCPKSRRYEQMER